MFWWSHFLFNCCNLSQQNKIMPWIRDGAAALVGVTFYVLILICWLSDCTPLLCQNHNKCRCILWLDGKLPFECDRINFLHRFLTLWIWPFERCRNIPKLGKTPLELCQIKTAFETCRTCNILYLKPFLDFCILYQRLSGKCPCSFSILVMLAKYVSLIHSPVVFDRVFSIKWASKAFS